MAIYEVIFSGTYYSQLWQHRFHLESVVGFAGNTSTICDLLIANWVPHERGFQVSDVVWSTVNVKNISGAPEQTIKPIALTGSQAGEPQRASFIAGVIQKKTGLAGRSNRGRLYVPGIRAGGTVLGQIVGPEMTNWTNVCAQLRINWCGDGIHGLRLVIKHPEGSTPVTDLVMRAILGSIRTRNIAVGG